MGLRHLQAHRTFAALRVAAFAMETAGTRSDLRGLEGIAVTGDPTEIAALIAETRFAVARRTGEGFVGS
jgi:hypothetical protein